MSIIEAIKKAEAGGYPERKVIHLEKEAIFLDRNFWIAVGKSLGWGDEVQGWFNGEEVIPMIPEWKSKWLNFILCLAEGKTAEDFFRDLK